MPIFDFKEFKPIVEKLKPYFPNTKKCIIIGSNESILSGKYGEYIDKTDATVVRINRLPLPEYSENYGTKTDWVISWLPSSYPNSIILPIHVYEQFARTNFGITRATTGFGAILILGCIFAEIELFGFGFSIPKYSDGLFHYFDGTVFKGFHDIREEDLAIVKLQQEYNGKIYRGEEKQ
jgi:hypothetical protein